GHAIGHRADGAVRCSVARAPELGRQPALRRVYGPCAVTAVDDLTVVMIASLPLHVTEGPGHDGAWQQRPHLRPPGPARGADLVLRDRARLLGTHRRASRDGPADAPGRVSRR